MFVHPSISQMVLYGCLFYFILCFSVLFHSIWLCSIISKCFYYIRFRSILLDCICPVDSNLVDSILWLAIMFCSFLLCWSLSFVYQFLCVFLLVSHAFLMLYFCCLVVLLFVVVAFCSSLFYCIFSYSLSFRSFFSLFVLYPFLSLSLSLVSLFSLIFWILFKRVSVVFCLLFVFILF